MHLITNFLRRLRHDEDGFTLAAVMGITAAVLAISVAAFAAADGDIRPGADDKERKQAYAAAEAGIADYLARLTAKPDYWRDCASDANNASINQVDPATRKWTPVEAGSPPAYSVEVLPANGAPTCSTADPIATFVDSSTGTFRIRATGRARANGGPRRSLIATFRRKGFLDYIYYTDLETSDPRWLRRETAGRETRENDGINPAGPERRNVEQWAEVECGYWNAGRGSKDWRADAADAGMKTGNTGNVNNDWTPWDPSGEDCGEIRFVSADEVKGPLHTNDHLLLCGTPKFGRSDKDDIEVSGTVTVGGTVTSYRQQSGCSGEPVVNDPGETDPTRGMLRPNAPRVELPPNNRSLRDEALPGYRFGGKTEIVLSGTTMSVNGFTESGVAVNKTMNLPSSGVINVANLTTGVCPTYDPLRPYTPAPACGDVWVSGNYSRSVTINADNDIIVQGNVTASGTAKPLLGLISNNWIRVYHPVNYDSNGDCTTNASNSPTNIRIEAAILSVNHSFAVDNYWCGAKLGNLTVVGAIAQKYRGIVGSGDSGYYKDYNYNEELRFRSPPRFLDPVQSTWRLKSQVEQVPAAT